MPPAKAQHSLGASAETVVEELVNRPEFDSDQLLERAAAGDASACNELLERHRARLRNMLWMRMDERLTARFDPSDVVQDALTEAADRLPAYLGARQIAFYPWLRRLALQKLIDLHRHHRAARRAVEREQEVQLSDRSAVMLAQRLTSPHPGPRRAAELRELGERVRQSLEKLDPNDREVLVMYHLEQMSVAEIGQFLGLSEAAVRSRRRRALERLSVLAKAWWETDS